MPQTMLLSNSVHAVLPSSPDPTPLRMLAFSVAEAALSSDPNSPLFLAQHKVASGPRFMDQNGDWEEAFQEGWKEWNGGVKAVSSRRSKMVWEVLEKAKERKEKTQFIEDAQTSPGVSPSAYNFILPPTSQLAASIARQQETSSCKPTRPWVQRPFALYETQSAEPSPTRSTFSTLDQTQPPPEFVPRLSAVDFVQEARKVSADVAAVRERRRSTIEPLSAAKLAEHTAATSTPPKSSRRSRLPSLQQIQARVTVTSRLRRSGSVDALPSVAVRPTSPRTQSCDSVDSVELRTPTDEIPNPLLNRRLALQRIMEKRPATPPSPPAGLSSFLRERTNGRIASGSKVTMSTPDKTTKPVLKVTPPSLENRPAVPPLHIGRANEISPTKSTFPFRSGYFTPTETRFAHPFAHLSTPPRSSSPTSPTTSIHSIRSGSTGMHGSPTLNMPIITCTPAPQVVLRDGLEQDSDDGSSDSGEFTLCDPDAELRAIEEKEMRERELREMKGMEMRMKLLRRRSSDSE